MDPESIPRVFSIVLLVSSLTASGVLRARAQRNGGPLQVQPEGRSRLAVLRLFALVAIAPLLAYFVNPSLLPFTQIALPTALRIVGAVLAIGGMGVALWAVYTLGTNITPTHYTREDHGLIASGPFRWIRHPLYSGGSIAWLGIILVTGVWVTGLALVFVGFILVSRVQLEEANLTESFGDAYREYSARTGRYFPRLG